MRVILAVVMTVAFGAGGLQAASPPVTVTDLRCEYRREPLGIDVAKPRLSWQLTVADRDLRDVRQTACHVCVASSREKLLQGDVDLWDSNVVQQDKSSLVEYQGRDLASNQDCYWRVRVRDSKGRWSPWSETSRWTMGLLKPGDWQGKWIGTAEQFEKKKGWPPPDNTMPDPWMRKTFTLEAQPRRAFVYVASIGYHELYINGQKADDTVLMPNVSTHKVRARYVTYDIAGKLRPGKNVIALWLGTSWSIFPHYKTDDKPQSPIVLAQAEFDLPGGQHLQIVSDESWKMHASPNTLMGVWDFMHYGGELYDVNREVKGWNEANFDDSAWKPAKTFAPTLELSAEMCEPNRLATPVKPVAIERLGPEEFRVDMGRNFAGFVELKLQGKPKGRINLQYSEREKDMMTHRHRSALIVDDRGEGAFRNRFNYSSARWIHIKGAVKAPELSDIRGFNVRTDYQRTGEFRCSNELFNNIYDTTLWTFENLSVGGYVVDCPQRERMGYGGDAHATTYAGLCNYGLGAFYTKWSLDWRDVQKPDGLLPHTAPTYWGGGGPSWCGFCITLPWAMYERYGDQRILDVNWPTIERWLAFLETQAKDDLLVRWGGQWDFLGDWLWPGAKGVNGDTPDTLCLNNCYWVYNLQNAAKIADVLKHDDKAAKYRARAEQVRKAIQKKFFNEEDASYASGMQAYQATALLANVPPQPLRAKAEARLEKEIRDVRKGHIHAGITGGALLFRYLIDNGRDDLIAEMVAKDDYPGWGDQLKRGATTFWEAWDDHASLLHSSYLYVGEWFTQGLLGIRQASDQAGFKLFAIKPGIGAAKYVSWAEGSYCGEYGPIRVRWELANNKCRVKVSVPPNSEALVYMPAKSVEQVTEGGRPARSAEGVTLFGVEGHRVVLLVGSGNYEFESSVPK